MNKDEFIEELKSIKININDEQMDLLEKYYKILIEKNKVMNLTGITEEEDVYLKHFFDSLTINKIIDLNSINNICDLGSGAGFPGIVLKILFPKLNIVLIDSLNKRVGFLNYVIEELNLKNIKAISSRIEDYSILNKEQFDLVTARAVAPTNILLELGIQLVRKNKYFITMKGKREEIDKNVFNQLNIIEEKAIEFNLPKENSSRTLTLFKKCGTTNKKFPRKYNEIKRKPL